MGFQDDYVMRTISDLVRAIARLALGKNDIDYELPEDEDKYTPMDRVYRQLKDMADAGDINGAENYLSDQLDPQDIDRLEMALTFRGELFAGGDCGRYQQRVRGIWHFGF